MLSIYSALFAEAQEIIRTFQLKKETDHHFEVFSDVEKGIRIVLTGVGAIAAATAVAEIATCYPPKSTDLVCNFGSCAAAEELPVGNVYLCNKLTEDISGRTFYPDISYRHPFDEAELISCAQIRETEQMKSDGIAGRQRLYDMEAAAIYQAANYYYGPHQMIFLKVVSDHGLDAKQTAQIVHMREAMATLMKNATSTVCPYLERLCEISRANEEAYGKQADLRREAEAEAAKLGEELHCSVVMQGELRQLLFYWKLTGTDYERVLEDYRRTCLPAKDKREGKRILDELKARL